MDEGEGEVSSPYTVTWALRDGNQRSWPCPTFKSALAFRDSLSGDARKTARIHGDGCEHDGERWHDGLTEEEREQL